MRKPNGFRYYNQVKIEKSYIPLTIYLKYKRLIAIASGIPIFKLLLHEKYTNFNNIIMLAMNSLSPELGIFFVMLLVFIGLFFILRGVVLWYFKINTMIDLLTKQLNKQEQILKHLRGEAEEPGKTP